MGDQENGEHDDVSIHTDRKIMQEILELYKDLPCLWDVSNKFYRDKEARNNSLEILLPKWKTVDKNITLEGVENKLDNMRFTFFRELMKVEASKSSVAAADVYKPSIWYYENLMFLYENQTPKKDDVKLDSAENEDSNNPVKKEVEKSDEKANPVKTTQIKDESKDIVENNQGDKDKAFNTGASHSSLNRFMTSPLKWWAKKKKERYLKRSLREQRQDAADEYHDLAMEKLQDSITHQKELHVLRRKNLKEKHKLEMMKLELEIDMLLSKKNLDI